MNGDRLRRLLVELTGSAAPEQLEAAVDLSTNVDSRCDVHLLLAALYQGVGLVDVDDELDAAMTAYVTVAVSRSGAPERSPMGETAPRGELVVDERLPWVSLLHLARQLAWVAPGRLSRVVVDELGGPPGVYERSTGTITLDVDRCATTSQLERTFAHELAHALDPVPASCGLARAERVAEAVGPKLLAARPATLDEAAALVTDHLPPPTDVDELSSLLIYLQTPLKVWNVALLVVAALAKSRTIDPSFRPLTPAGPFGSSRVIFSARPSLLGNHRRPFRAPAKNENWGRRSLSHRLCTLEGQP